MGELGRTPIGLSVISSSLRYLIRLEYAEKGSILHEAFEVSKTVSLQSRKSWATSCLTIKEFGITNGNLDETIIFNKKQVKNFLFSNYEKYWTKKINEQAKIRTYRKFKSHLEYEECLNIPNTNHCKARAKLKISAHRLAIEQG